MSETAEATDEASSGGHGHGTKAILAALSANLGIALVKLIAWFFSGSASMLAEGIHSIADSANQLLLLVGGRRARRVADEEHPFGYGRERYVYAFVVSIILFSVGGVFSLYEGVDKLRHPHPLEVWWLPLGILVIAMFLEGFSLRTALGEARPHKGSLGWFQFIRRAKAPELPVLLLEDTAALTGLVLAFLGVLLTVVTGDGVFDGIGTVLIGVLLILVAIILGVETKSLLVGEGASADDVAAIRSAITSGPEVERIIHMKTLYLGPDELLVAVKVAMPGKQLLADVASAINQIEARIRGAVPVARVIYVEPDVWVSPTAAEPPTETIVLKSSD
ncbi:cation diffusion facilitator family transporter [Frondihabitans australicus]|uniref:Cation diffusion facilitator family transporter n=1 Tax=Frondihabitans australicus TaxID=386892 RepID=A0A495IAK9_9MICO|nr:cation diffusion facilitator family transporter [Frondihabitans australicus]RKR73044.1 cation diffusion facilitator family transporter [Frondihabitans australicus]